MATFSQWLVAQRPEPGAQPTPIGALGQLWFDSAKVRPRTSGVERVTSWLAEHAGEAGLRPEAAMELLTMAAAEYRTQREQTATAVPGVPADVTARMTPGQRSDALAGNTVIVPAQSPGGSTQPPIPAAELPIVAAIVQALLPVVERLDGKLAQILVWQADQDKRIAPITRLLDEIGMAEDQADQLDADPAQQAADDGQRSWPVPSEGQERVRAIAEGNGWLPAQEPAQASVSLYGGHVVDTTAAWQQAYDEAPAGEDPA